MSDKRDFFISFTWADVEIATAINDALRSAGFSTWFHPTDKPKGAGIADWMEVALDASNQMLALCSDAYFDREKGYSRAERQSMFWEDPTNNAPLLILVKVADCKFPRLIAQNEYISLTGLQRPEAAAKLVAELQSEQARLASVKAAQVDRSRAHPAIFNVQGGINPLFTGRNAELAMLHDRIKSDTATAITAVQGMGGIGKTSLAREYAHRFGTAARFGGVWWIEAETPSGILAAYDRLAERLEDAVKREADQENTGEAVRDWLGQQPDSAPWLVIFDNAPDDETVATWLPKGSAKVIITSRYGGFDTIADLLSLDFWDTATTAQFLQTRTGRGSEADALSLAARLDGLPLAAEQAGAYLRENATLPFRAYEDRLIRMLERAPKVLPGGYDKSLYATFRTAIEAIAERPNGTAAQGILNLCAYLSPDGVELEILMVIARQSDVLPDPPRAALADEVDCAEAVAALSAYSLIRLGEVPGVGQILIMHRLLGDIARDLLGTDGQTLWSGTAVMMIRLIIQSVGNRGGPSTTPSIWPIFGRLAPHAHALCSLRPGTNASGKSLAYVLDQVGTYLHTRGDSDGALQATRRAVEVSEIVHTGASREFAIALSNLAIQLSENEAYWVAAEEAFTRALEIKKSILARDDPSLAATLSNFGTLQMQRGNFAEAARLTEQAAEIDKRIHGDNSAEFAIRLSNLGSIHDYWARASGESEHFDKKGEFYRKAARMIHIVRGPRHSEMAVQFNNLALIQVDAGALASAAVEMAKALAVQHSLDQNTHPQTQTYITSLLELWTMSGQSDKAARLKAGDPSDLLPFVEQIEAEHRAWVAEDPENRQFGPPSPVTGATA